MLKGRLTTHDMYKPSNSFQCRDQRHINGKPPGHFVMPLCTPANLNTRQATLYTSYSLHLLTGTGANPYINASTV